MAIGILATTISLRPRSPWSDSGGRIRIKRRYTVLLDCGDTLVDEATEVKDARGATQKAELIPGAADMVRGLVAKGYRIALDALGIGPAAYDRVVMVGNNLERDIRGTNALGIASVWISWSPRRAKFPTDPRDVPKHQIKNPLELLDLMDRLESEADGA